MKWHRPAVKQVGRSPWYGYSGRPPGPNPADAVLFVAIPGSVKVRCVVCDSNGYPSTEHSESRWQRPHRRGHRPCLECGRQLAVRLDGTARRHSRCPGPISVARSDLYPTKEQNIA